jgi:serine/threonine protein kinase
MAIVYEAIDIQLGRRVALKVLPPEMAMRRSMAERFKREAKMAAALDHPNIVPVYRVGQAGGLLYIAMKFIKGRALDTILESQGPLHIPVVLLILRAASRALAYAHERGIVHRDVKSANIMIDTEGHAVVSDFGIARAVEEPNITATGTVVGTPYFMSPEQCAARRIGPQSDQYSLGVVAFQMLTGTVPFSADTLPGIMHHHFYTDVPDVRSSRPEIPAPLHEIINKMLSKKSEHRYASTAALATAIQEIPLGEPERRDAERILRDLAGGAPAPRINVDTLPPLLSSVRLTPADGSAIHGLFRRRFSQPVMALAGALTLVLAGGTGWWLSARDARASAGESAPDLPRISDSPAVSRIPPTIGTSASKSGASRSAPVKTVASSSTAAANVERGGARPPDESTPTAAPLRAPIVDRTVVTSASAPPPMPDGKLRLRVEPGHAEIWIDDRVIGTGLVFDVAIPAGTRRLRLTAQGYATRDTTFDVGSGETTNLQTITLVPRGSSR